MWWGERGCCDVGEVGGERSAADLVLQPGWKWNGVHGGSGGGGVNAWVN